jgi:hypothetical protein
MLHLFSLGVIYYWVTPDDQIRMLYEPIAKLSASMAFRDP